MLTAGGAGISSAQRGDSMTVYQLSGLVVGEKSHEPVPYAMVRINRSRRGIIANSEGFYSIPVVAGDTVYFSSIGYRRSGLVMKQYLEEYEGNKESQYLYAINYLTEDTVQLPPVYLFPYDTPEKLKAAMLAMDVPIFGPDVYAAQNMDPRVLDQYIENLPKDDAERLVVGRQLYYDRYMTKGIAPTMPLINPIAAFMLLKYINDKAKEKREKDLNTWED